MAAPIFEFLDEAEFVRDFRPYRDCGKRLFDLAVALALLPVVGPLLLLIMALTALSGGRPLFAQTRIGRGGRPFTCWKLRTMVPDAEARLERILAADPALAEEWRRHQKLRRDPRVTALGRILRRLSLNELPQIWNVLNGTMSLVGPRPILPEQAARYEAGRCCAHYHALRPGITGLWQVGPRSEGSFEERAAHDREYFRKISLATDLAVLARTAAVVIRATGR